jgi:predicted nucleotidyltransferase
MEPDTGIAPITLAGLRARRRELLLIAERHGASNVRVFGSVLRGDASPGSDVDFLVSLDERRSLLDLGGLQMDLRDALGCEVDIVTDTGLRERIRDDIRAAAAPL